VTLPITDGKTLILFSLKLSLSSSCNNTTKSEIIEKVTLSVEKKKKESKKSCREKHRKRALDRRSPMYTLSTL